MAVGSDLIPLVAAVIAIGVAAQVLADRFQVPSIVFLIAAGVALGPEGIGVLGPAAFGGALSAIVGLSVAIIVFEGAFHIDVATLREAPSATLRLVTVGALVALVGTALTVHAFTAATWRVSFLIGALLVATGPTVITPILGVVPVRRRVAGLLETEGIVNDVTAAILAVVIFEAIRADITDPVSVVRLFASRLGTGLLVGAVVAGVVYYLLRHVDLSPGNAPQNARLLVLAAALVAFGAADYILPEAGVAAVAIAGLLLGNADLPYEDDIAAFKGDITLLVLSFVFIALAGLLRISDLLALGIGGLAVVVAVALLIRPAIVFLSTAGERFTFREKLFVASVGPRGIIPASVATLFAIELRDIDGMTAQADILVGTVFLVILLTVVFEGGFARHIAERLDVIPMRVLVIGGGTVGRSLADRLHDRGEDVVIVEQNEAVIETARDEGFTVHSGDGTDTDVLRSAGAGNAKTVVAATGDDDVNLLVSQLADSKFDPETILARVNNPDNVEAFEDLGVRTVSSTLATAWALDNLIERPALADWMTNIGHSGDSGDVQEIECDGSEVVGRPVEEIGPELPDDCLIALVTRDGETFVPESGLTIEDGDRVTLIGGREAVSEAMAWLHPGD
jgi:NhaP-type Na+/H+ or K+/H+ antiporter/Trk K+ transport system NAD-binding subunit